MSFGTNKTQYSQTHFNVIEITLPVVNGECTINGVSGYGTPLTCDQPGNGSKVYKFTETNAPLLNESGIYRCVTKINETPTQIKSGRGLASRGSINITLADFKNADPNPFSPAIIEQGTKKGSYLAKLDARNILTGKQIVIKNYRLGADGNVDLALDSEDRYYIIEKFSYNKNGTWTIIAKDELSKLNLNETVYPEPASGSLRADMNAGQTTIFVDGVTTYEAGQTIRIGDELIKIASVSGIGTGSATIQAVSRGGNISYTNVLSATEASSHSTGDEIFICKVYDNEYIYNVIYDVLISAGVDAGVIDITDWSDEIDLWLPNSRINTILVESVDTSEVLEMILTDYMIDLWFDPVNRSIDVSCNSSWQQSRASLTEGNEIDYETISKSLNESLRATRSFVVYDKVNLVKNDDVENFRKASIYKRTDLESADLYGKAKVKKHNYSSLLNKDDADLLVNRWVNRYNNPYDYTWTTQERKLDFEVGDVVDLVTSADVGFDGLPSNNKRAQIISIKPNYRDVGRDYTVKALSYQPLFDADSEIVLTGIYTSINLFTQFADGASSAVELTFVLDGATIQSDNTLTPALRAGNFVAGSIINLILINGAEIIGAGGDGGKGGNLKIIKFGTITLTDPPTDGKNGGVSLDADGVTMNIYLSGSTGVAKYPTADGYIKAPSGGAGGFVASTFDETSGNGGKGGNGRISGAGGLAGDAINAEQGNNGQDGSSASTATYGENGANNDAIGGTMGKGIVDSGGTVTLQTTADRYVNGGGDH